MKDVQTKHGVYYGNGNLQSEPRLDKAIRHIKDWLILKLAGKRQIMINMNITGTQPINAKKGALIHSNTFHYNATTDTAKDN